MHTVEIIIAVASVLASAWGALKPEPLATACGSILVAVCVLLILVT